MTALDRVKDPLLGGFYTVSEAARLLRIENKQRIYRWLRDDDAPVVMRDYKPLDGTQELSFWDLFEIHFVETFRQQGLSLQLLRKVAAKARTELNTNHPFALARTSFLTDRKRIFLQMAEELGERKTHDLLSGQYEFYETIEAVVAKNVSFNPRTMLAEEWPPLPEVPNVIINPRYSYGQPVVGEIKVPTAALYKLWMAEGSKDKVAKWFGVTLEDVESAIEFEVRLPN